MSMVYDRAWFHISARILEEKESFPLKLREMEQAQEEDRKERQTSKSELMEEERTAESIL